LGVPHEEDRDHDPLKESGTGIDRGRGAGSRETMRVRKCRLDVVAGPDAGVSAVFASPRIVIGRGGADLVLSDRKVSALHFEILLDDRGYRLRDVGSTNGTFVWGMRIVEAHIGPGCTIGVGDTAIRFVPLSDSIELPLWNDERLCGLVGRSHGMRRMFETIDRVAASDTTVLITGETGTGKELVAEAIHERSPRSRGPFVVLDCGAVPANLFEDQLFGHEAGAFTDARRATTGVFEAAAGGTLFLDEIGELPLDVQPKLLRAVETLRIRPVGGMKTVDCDVRVIAATNRDLAAEVNRKNFRADLYFRIAVARLHVPPLRERPEDIELLVKHFLDGFPPTTPRTLPEGFVDWATRHPWPGNVRELRNAVERAVAEPDLPASAEHKAPAGEGTRGMEIDLGVPFKDAKRQLVDEFDRRYITALLESHDWNIASASRAAGIDRMSIYKLLQRLDIRRRGG
jgi:transcriptional regulator with GAF, ATPase, and Fis domain